MCGRIKRGNQELLLVAGASVPTSWATDKYRRHPNSLPPLSSHRFIRMERWGDLWKGLTKAVYQLDVTAFQEGPWEFTLSPNQRLLLVVHEAQAGQDPMEVCSIVTVPAAGNVAKHLTHEGARMPRTQRAWEAHPVKV